MGRISSLLSDDVVVACNSGLKKLGKIGIVAGRLQIILAAKKHGITEVCRIHCISRTTVQIGLDAFNEAESKSSKTNLNDRKACYIIMRILLKK